MHFATQLAILAGLSKTTAALDFLGIDIPDGLLSGLWYGAPKNDFNCVDSRGRNPVVLLHGLSASREVDLNLLHKDMAREGWCVFAETYGSPKGVSFVGGLTDMKESAEQVGDFIREVASKTGRKVDVVGHSEGGVQALYVPMTKPEVAKVIDRTVALGPAVHGAHYFGVADFYQKLPKAIVELIRSKVTKLCDACLDMENADGEIYKAFKTSPKIVPNNIKASIIMSRSDTLVAPDSSEVFEPNVRNLYVQDKCPDDHLGHANLAWSTSVWGMIKNELQGTNAPIKCDNGAPWRA